MRTTEWMQLATPGTALRMAREQCHHAVQINTHLARAVLMEQPDDSHTSLSWDSDFGALVGRQVNGFRLGLRLQDLTLLWIDASRQQLASLSLEGRTFEEAMAWTEQRLTAAGVNADELRNPLHFTLEPHELQTGGTFRVEGLEAQFAELAKWYGNAVICLEALSSPVRCWPHHFDIAVQLPAKSGSLGAGMSPGDASYSQPYFYVTPWPYPPVETLAALERGYWHAEGWVGAVLTAEELLASTDQAETTLLFVKAAAGLLNNLHG